MNRRLFLPGLLLVAGLWRCPVYGAGPEPSTPSPAERISAQLDQAERSFRRRAYPDALRVVNSVLAEDANNLRAYNLRASIHEQQNEHAKVAADLTEMIRLLPADPNLHQRRGEACFKAARIKESLADFDKVLELVPRQAPHHWQRGIALYYAGRFEDGRKQFELHQTVNAHDVENAVWHFLCTARAASLEQARAALIPIQGDARVPMAQIHDLFAGKGTEQAVLDAANAGQPGLDQLRDRLFYAHLYLALYHEAGGKPAKVLEHLQLATTAYARPHYMGDVARVHLQLLKTEKK